MSDEEDLLLEKLSVGDRPSIYAAGLVCARSLKENGIAVLMTDVLGRVHLLPGEVVEVKRRPKVTDEELNQIPEDDALRLLVLQGESEDAVIEYLKRRVSTDPQETL